MPGEALSFFRCNGTATGRPGSCPAVRVRLPPRRHLHLEDAQACFLCAASVASGLLSHSSRDPTSGRR